EDAAQIDRAFRTLVLVEDQAGFLIGATGATVKSCHPRLPNASEMPSGRGETQSPQTTIEMDVVKVEVRHDTDFRFAGWGRVAGMHGLPEHVRAQTAVLQRTAEGDRCSSRASAGNPATAVPAARRLPGPAAQSDAPAAGALDFQDAAANRIATAA